MTTIGQIAKTFVDCTFETIEDASHQLRPLHYISGGDGLFPIYVIDQDGKGTMYYIHKDYQGKCNYAFLLRDFRSLFYIRKLSNED